MRPPTSGFRFFNAEECLRNGRKARYAKHKNAGMALVVTLSLIVLATIAVMAFFARAMFNRNIEASRTNQVMATQVADSALDYIVGQFLSEISGNSVAATNSGIPIYRPTHATNAVPLRKIASGIPTTDPNFFNLVRQSIPVADTNASTISTTTAARNGRSIGAANWNSPRFVSGAGFVNLNQLPNWIYLNADGSVTNAPATNALGRFAYNVYDEGGLLDVNVAGYPQGVSGASLAVLKGSLAGADLSVIPDIADSATMNVFVQWRNVASAVSAANYVNAVTNSAVTGFFQAQPGDNRVFNRQDLIKFAQNGSYGITPAALPYLTTFTRTLNAPSWSPTTPDGSAIDYAAIENSGTNRFLPNVRVASSFTRADGTLAKTGEPLLKARFPLSRLLGLGRNGVNGIGNTTLLSGVSSPASAATIQRDFGLVWSGDRWVYAGPYGSGASTSIATLDSITNREPNFFELLKASILSGSLGKALGVTQIDTLAFDESEDNQIIQIGANIKIGRAHV